MIYPPPMDGDIAAEFERYRDLTFCRTARLRITSEHAALEFINRTGFCSAFTAGLGLPCLREAIAGEREPPLPEHIQHDPAIMMTWRIKDSLPARGAVYYGKVVAGRPSFVALDLLPAFLRVRAPAVGYRTLHQRGELSRCAFLVMEALTKNGPLETRALKLASGCARPHQRAEFDRAMKELQGKFLALKIEERYEPFTYIWDTFSRRFGPIMAEARKMARNQAVEQIISRHIENVGYTTAPEIARLIAIAPFEVERSMQKLERGGFIIRGARINGRAYDVLAKLYAAVEKRLT
jgi:hypothetical protein